MGFSHLVLLMLVSVEFLCPHPVRGKAEVGALMEIKASLDPENKILTSWTENGDPCSGSFVGVACNEHLKVANISLQGKGLSGSISPSIADLKCLSGLYLHYNSLTGLIPKEISNLTELTELYLGMNNLSGIIPPEIGDMTAVQVLQLCYNNFTGTIPENLGSLKKLSVLNLQHNELSGPIPPSLGNLGTLTRLMLSFNHLTGKIPSSVASLQELQFLDVQDNSLSGIVPSALKRLDRAFLHQNNPGLCGFNFPSLRNCSTFDDADISNDLPFGANTNRTVPIRNAPNQRHSQSLSKLPLAAIVITITTVTIALLVTALVTFYRYRRSKQKISSAVNPSESRFSNSQSKDVQSRSASPLANLEYSTGWDPLDDTNGLFLQGFRYTLEEIESATHYFSDANLLGKSKFSSVYKGVLRDGSVVAIRSINAMSCKSEENEFVDGLNLVTSLNHDNLVKVRGFCCSKGRGECFLVYDFATKGNLLQYLDIEDGCCRRPLPLDWCARISIIKGIARGIRYLHTAEPDRPTLVHRSISAEKTLIDQQLNPLIMDSGLPKLLANDVIFSALKTSAAMGCLAPEYITTGRFTEKSDVYSFGIVVFQILSGKQRVTCSMKLAAESPSSNLKDLIDVNLEGKFVESEAVKLARIATECIRDDPESRPSMFMVVEELDEGFDSGGR